MAPLSHSLLPSDSSSQHSLSLQAEGAWCVHLFTCLRIGALRSQSWGNDVKVGTLWQALKRVREKASEEGREESHRILWEGGLLALLFFLLAPLGSVPLGLSQTDRDPVEGWFFSLSLHRLRAAPRAHYLGVSSPHSLEFKIKSHYHSSASVPTKSQLCLPPENLKPGSL